MKKLFDRYNGKEVYLYTITDGLVSVDVCDLGARINAITVGGKDVALGFNSVADYLASGCYAGATVGRCCNRIKGARFVLGGKEYILNNNEGANHIHGGVVGFDKRFFKAECVTESSITFGLESADGDENYPGKLLLSVTYTVEGGSLKIEYAACSDKDTLCNLTNHTYFNLDGEDSGDCLETLISINADSYTPTDNELIPTGEIRSVEGTVFDFKSERPIKFDEECEEIKATHGYDNNFILNGSRAARARSLKTGITMDVYTSMPCLQFYVAGSLGACNGKTRAYGRWSGFCLEPQYCPNAINSSGFEKPLLKANEKKTYYIKYVFGTDKQQNEK